MKDALLKIIESHEYWTFGANKSATEIADLVKAFIEWCVEAPLIVRTDHKTWEVYKNQENYEWGDPYEEMNIDRLFEFWYNEIRK